MPYQTPLLQRIRKKLVSWETLLHDRFVDNVELKVFF